jgi:hypothetical protein
MSNNCWREARWSVLGDKGTPPCLLIRSLASIVCPVGLCPLGQFRTMLQSCPSHPVFALSLRSVAIQ